MIIDTPSTSPSPEEGKQRQQLLSGAQAIMRQIHKFTQQTQEKLQEAFDAGDYTEVTKIAAEVDVVQRRSIASKITAIPNPNFKPDSQARIHDEIVSGFLGRFTPEQIDAFLRQAEEEQRRATEAMKPQEDREPPLLFKIEGIDGTFKSASAAAEAYRAKFGPDTKTNKVVKRFKSKPLFVEDQEISDIIAHIVPPRGSVPDTLVESKGESECDNTQSVS